jgi:hypothetical protein
MCIRDWDYSLKSGASGSTMTAWVGPKLCKQSAKNGLRKGFPMIQLVSLGLSRNWELTSPQKGVKNQPQQGNR